MGIHVEIPLNINLEINSERQDCKIGTVWGEEWLRVRGGK
jgi:hypothetical protein